MPTASAGNNIASSTQINAGVVEGTDIATDAITKDKIAANEVEASEIATGAVGTAEVANDSIINEDIKSDAAIDDSKLAEINDANKVDGSALKGLANIPVGAGVIPAANLPASNPSFALATVGDTAIASADTARLTGQVAAYTKKKEIRLLGTGTYRIKFSLRNTGSSPTNNTFGRVYKNGVAVGTERTHASATIAEYSEDLTFATNDLVQIYAWQQNYAAATVDVEVSLFRVCGVETAISATTIVTD